MNSFGHAFYGTRTEAAEATPENPESRSRRSPTRIVAGSHSLSRPRGLFGPELLAAHDPLGYAVALVADRPLFFLLPERFGSTVFR